MLDHANALLARKTREEWGEEDYQRILAQKRQAERRIEYCDRILEELEKRGENNWLEREAAITPASLSLQDSV